MLRTASWMVFVAIAFGLCSQAQGARLIKVEIEHRGKPVLTTYYADDGYPPPEEVWRYLGHAPNMVEDESASVTPAADDPLKAKLEGDVVISVNRRDSQARFKDLMLVRDDATKQQWYLPADEVQRTARIAGLGPIPPRRPNVFEERSYVRIAIMVALILGLAVVVFLQLRSPKQSFQ